MINDQQWMDWGLLKRIMEKNGETENYVMNILVKAVSNVKEKSHKNSQST